MSNNLRSKSGVLWSYTTQLVGRCSSQRFGPALIHCLPNNTIQNEGPTFKTHLFSPAAHPTHRAPWVFLARASEAPAKLVQSAEVFVRPHSELSPGNSVREGTGSGDQNAQGKRASVPQVHLGHGGTGGTGIRSLTKRQINHFKALQQPSQPTVLLPGIELGQGRAAAPGDLGQLQEILLAQGVLGRGAHRGDRGSAAATVRRFEASGEGVERRGRS